MDLKDFEIGQGGTYINDYIKSGMKIGGSTIPDHVAVAIWRAVNPSREDGASINKEFVCIGRADNDYMTFLYKHDFKYWIYIIKP